MKYLLEESSTREGLLVLVSILFIYWEQKVRISSARYPSAIEPSGCACWIRCFDVSKSKRKAWRPCCWVCVCCLVVWNLLIHSLRWSKFIWIFNLLKRWVSKMLLKFQQVVSWNNRLFYLSSFWKGFEKLDFAVKSIQPIVSTKQSIVFL